MSVDVVISHHEMDSPAKSLKELCESYGYSVFLDIVSLKPGDHHNTVLVSTAASCKVFVVLLTPGWCTSKQAEYVCNVAVRAALMPNATGPLIIPVVLSDISQYEKLPVVLGLLANRQRYQVGVHQEGMWKPVIDAIKAKVKEGENTQKEALYSSVLSIISRGENPPVPPSDRPNLKDAAKPYRERRRRSRHSNNRTNVKSDARDFGNERLKENKSKADQERKQSKQAAVSSRREQEVKKS